MCKSKFLYSYEHRPLLVGNTSSEPSAGDVILLFDSTYRSLTHESPYLVRRVAKIEEALYQEPRYFMEERELKYEQWAYKLIGACSVGFHIKVPIYATPSRSWEVERFRDSVYPADWMI